MPELPEVEVVRRGLERWVAGRAVDGVAVLHPRAVRRHAAGGRDFADRLAGAVLGAPRRRGKYLWVPVAGTGTSLLAHLGMSGQLLVQPAGAPDERHLRVRIRLAEPAAGTPAAGTVGTPAVDTAATPAADTVGAPAAGTAGHLAADTAGTPAVPGPGARPVPGPQPSAGADPATPAGPDDWQNTADAAPPVPPAELRFVDQRTFGGLSLHPDTADGVPDVIAHIARDPLDPGFDEDAFHAALRRRRTTVKRALLDQSLISGVGNIYADEALWRARLHYDRPTATLTRQRTAELVSHLREVMAAALAVGGTSFDSLYVNVNGESGYFERSLDAYGREDEPCRRCGTPLRRRPWMNRSSYFCPRCQRPFRSRSSASTTARPRRSAPPHPASGSRS
ncbi:bifunctional DNA-formamidopyrimidine glycosylase/DNA-(apurinic or apyrimidinic site) lyase [Streptomyces sp. JJ36]|uniref:bifunctional DNA-formamidopyrimidine glycosylase/DNA-(apurinic or apyrimidinic site) lyase n=1 Tax=Streptomyces sp. JJ36 TaxID=2736645 RepID=UPI001EFFF692|nr:bifunctional DNA-formamidopyrimidine glycosylase/DNA-(apurinic or apyrimidinic site) lyase [Streptomyces sp. JJ36]